MTEGWLRAGKICPAGPFRVDRRAAFVERLRAMKNVASLAAAVVIFTTLVPGAVSHARVGPRLITLRLEGYVGDAPEGRRERADLSLRAGEKDFRFQVTRAIETSGKMMPSQIFSRVRPYRPNFILRGKQEMLQRLENAAPGDRFRIVGGWRPGSRDLLVSSVEAMEAPGEPAKR
jgi:hypothetical protein